MTVPQPPFTSAISAKGLDKYSDPAPALTGEEKSSGHISHCEILYQSVLMIVSREGLDYV